MQNEIFSSSDGWRVRSKADAPMPVAVGIPTNMPIPFGAVWINLKAGAKGPITAPRAPAPTPYPIDHPIPSNADLVFVENPTGS